MTNCVKSDERGQGDRVQTDDFEPRATRLALRRYQRALAVLRECNRILVGAVEARQLMQEVCRIAVERGGYRLSWIGLRQFDDACSVMPAASAGSDDGYLERVKVTWSDTERGQGPTGKAIRTERSAVARFILTDPDFAPWREDALERGFGSSIALPILDDEKCVGALMIYAAEPDAFDDEEQGLLDEMAHDLGYGLSALRSRAARRAAEQRVAHLNSVLRGIRRVNQLILRQRDPQTLIQQVCCLLVESRGYLTASIVLNGDGRIRAYADAGLEERLAPLRTTIARSSLPPCIEHALQRTDIYSNPQDTSLCGGCTVCQDANGRPIAAAAVRMECENKVYGVLLVSLPSGIATDDEELELLGQVSGDIAFALRAADLLADRERSETRYRELVANLDDVVFSLDPDGVIQYVSPVMKRVYGYLPDELRGKHFSELVHPEDVPAWSCSFESTLKGVVCPFEFRGRDKSGRPRHLRVTSRVHMDGDSVVGADGVLIDFTALRNAQDAQHHTEVILRNAFLASPAAISIGDLDEDCRVLAVNEAFEQITGFTRDDALGRNWADLNLYMDETLRTGIIEQAQASGRVRNVDFSFRMKNGQCRHGLLNAVVSHINGKRHLVSVITDTTEQRRAQLDLQQRLQFETMLANVAALFLDIVDEGVDSAIAAAQSQICTCFGLDTCGIWQSQSPGGSLVLTYVYWKEGPADGLVGLAAADAFPWLERQLCMTGRITVIAERDALPAAAARDRSTCAKFGITNTLVIPWRSPDGQLNGAIGFSSTHHHNPTTVEIGQLETIAQLLLVVLSRSRERQERAAGRERMRLLTEMLDEAPAGIVIHDADGAFLYANRYAVSMHGYHIDEFGRLALADIVRIDAHDEMAARLQRVLERGEDSFTIWHRRKDGTAMHVDVTSRKVTWNELDAILSVQIDLTERERSAAALHESEHERRELQQQLYQAQKMEAIGQLAGGIAHDFNNLLSVIHSYTGFVLSELRDGDPLRTDVEEVQKAGDRAATLTRQLLAFSRKQILEPTVLDLNQVVTGIETMLRRLVGEHIQVDVQLSEDLGTVLADAGQIEQMIMNLVVNARDAMPDGGLLRIRTDNVELGPNKRRTQGPLKPGRYVTVSVADTGCGMDSKTLARIFEPFFTTKGLGKGTGLGLSTVYGIVKQSGGEILVDSKPRGGTSFAVYLPRQDLAVAVQPRRTESLVTAGREVVLIVEDEDAVRKLAERILSNAGYRVLSARSGGDALVTLEKHPGRVDLLLTDVVMPQMSGRELATRVAQLDPKIHVLYMSGYTDDAIAHHGVLDPGAHLLAKPFAAAELTRKVREVLDMAGIDPEALVVHSTPRTK